MGKIKRKTQQSVRKTFTFKSCPFILQMRSIRELVRRVRRKKENVIEMRNHEDPEKQREMRK